MAYLRLSATAPKELDDGLGDSRVARSPALAVRGHHDPTVLRNRSLRKRHGDIAGTAPRRPGKSRWTRGHAVWVSDVLAFRAARPPGTRTSCR